MVTNAAAALVKAAHQSMQPLKGAGTSVYSLGIALDHGTALTGRQYFWKVALLSKNCT